MRFIKASFLFLSIAVMLLAVEVVLRLPTETERELAGPGHVRSDIAQMRLARMILAVGPERGSGALAALTGADAGTVEANLRDIGRVGIETTELAAPAAEEEEAGNSLPAIRRMSDPGRRGGARFVKVN